MPCSNSIFKFSVDSFFKLKSIMMVIYQEDSEKVVLYMQYISVSCKINNLHIFFFIHANYFQKTNRYFIK